MILRRIRAKKALSLLILASLVSCFTLVIGQSEKVRTGANLDRGQTYINNQYNISFTYSDGWYIGDNRLGYGSFQLFNYNPAEVFSDGKGGMREGGAKIEVMITNGSIPEESSDYPSVEFENKNIEIKGRAATMTRWVNATGDKIIAYKIPLNNKEGDHLSITAYGEDIAFEALEMIIESLQFLQ